MVDPDSGGQGRLRCLGYVAFRRKYDTDPEFAGWFAPLLEQIDGLIADPVAARARLTTIYNALIDLIAFLDPRRVWVLGSRDKILQEPHPEQRE